MSVGTTAIRAGRALAIGFAVYLAAGAPAHANCSLFAMEQAARAGDSLELRGASLAPRFAGIGNGPALEEYCADVAFDLEDTVHSRYQRHENDRVMQESVSIAADRSLLAGIEAGATATRRLNANGLGETRIAPRIAMDGVQASGSWARTREEDRYSLSVAEDWMSGPGLSLSARHGITTAHRWAEGELAVTGLSSRIDAGYDGWSLGLARSGPAPVGRIDIYEVEVGFPAFDAVIYPETTGVRARWDEGMITGMATWMDWSLFDTDFGFEASSANREDWTLVLGWRFPDPILGAMEINAGMTFDFLPTSTERQVALAGELNW